MKKQKGEVVFLLAAVIAIYTVLAISLVPKTPVEHHPDHDPDMYKTEVEHGSVQ